MNAKSPKLMLVPAANMHISPETQRQFTLRHGVHIRDNYSQDKVGILSGHLDGEVPRAGA